MLKLLAGGKAANIRPETRLRFPARAEIAHRLTLARELAGLTVRQAGRMTNIAAEYVSSFEAAVAEPTARDLQLLAEVYAVSMDWVLGRVPEQACPSELEGYAAKLPEETRFRLLTILASVREANQVEALRMPPPAPPVPPVPPTIRLGRFRVLGQERRVTGISRQGADQVVLQLHPVRPGVQGA